MKKLILVLTLVLIPSFVFAEDIYTKGALERYRP